MRLLGRDTKTQLSFSTLYLSLSLTFDMKLFVIIHQGLNQSNFVIV